MLSNFFASKSNKMNMAIPELSIYDKRNDIYNVNIILVIVYFNIKSKHFHCVPWDWEACFFVAIVAS